MTVRTPMINGNTDSAETFRLALSGLWVPASAMNARTGTTSAPTLTSTGSLTATVSAFTCVVDGTSNSLQGAYPVCNDAAATITIGAGNTQARIDLICLQIQDNDYDGSGQHRGIPVVVAGTPSGSPAVPATPANAIPLWTLPVPALASSVTFSTATAVFPFTAAAGGIVPARNAADKPAVVNGVQYRHRLDVTAAAGAVTPLESSTDSVTWTPVYDPAALFTAWTALTANTPGSTLPGTRPLQGRVGPGGIVELAGGITLTTPVNGGVVSGTLPSWAQTASFKNFTISIFLSGSVVPFFGQISGGGTGSISLSWNGSVTAGTTVYFDGVTYPVGV